MTLVIRHEGANDVARPNILVPNSVSTEPKNRSKF